MTSVAVLAPGMVACVSITPPLAAPAPGGSTFYCASDFKTAQVLSSRQVAADVRSTTVIEAGFDTVEGESRDLSESPRTTVRLSFVFVDA